MGVTINIDGGKSYTCLDFDELTLADWRRLTIPKLIEGDVVDQLAVSHEMIRRHTGIPIAQLRRARPADVDALIDAIGETLRLAAEAMMEDPDYRPPKTLAIGTRTFTIPADLERDTIYGQWCDLASIDGMEHEADIYTRILAVLLTEGEPYDAGQVAGRSKLLLDARMVEVFPLCAFFFSNNERFRNAVNLALDRYRTSMLLRLRPVPSTASKSSSTDTPTTSDPSGPPS